MTISLEYFVNILNLSLLNFIRKCLVIAIVIIIMSYYRQAERIKRNRNILFRFPSFLVINKKLINKD